ncbi:MAG: glycosyltransferase family 2 protein [Acidobacteria bacterium]|nr:glycosyltransferase family 2 protein [Acidobacteriota bacterium]MBI3657916.1 glycosyltransferase family 2 protein [Acidobacteriota bacterium]
MKKVCKEFGRRDLTVIILTYNEAANLPDCLQSLKGLEGDIFVVDSGSDDATLEIARSIGARIVQHPFVNYSLQRNWAQQHLPIATEWILHLDAGERLTRELVAEINAVLRDPPTGIDGFLLRRQTYFMGRWIKHGGHYPSYHLRLFRRGKGLCEDRLYDQHFLVNGKVNPLRHDFTDVVTSDLSTWIVRHTRWAELEAQEMMTHDRTKSLVRPRLLGNSIERRRWLRQGLYEAMPLFARPFLYWFYRYIFRLGFLDGKEGLVFHFLQGCWYRFFVDLQLHALRQASRRPPAVGHTHA